MIRGIKLIPSGFDLIDKNWGGVYKGGSYLNVAPKKSGRTLLGLQFAGEAARNSQVCLYLTNMKPKDLMIQSASINFNLQSYMDDDKIIVVRIANPTDAYESNNPDFELREYLLDIIRIAEEYSPARIVFDEITPYLGFADTKMLLGVMSKILENLEEQDITSLFITSQPADELSSQIIADVSDLFTAQISLTDNDKISRKDKPAGIARIIPNVGHPEGEFINHYYIEPFIGLTTEKNAVKPIETVIPDHLNLPSSIEEILNQEDMLAPNLYEYDDFLLMLNNQIALNKGTGQPYSIAVFRLESSPGIRGLTINELTNIIRLSVEMRDKIYINENIITVLIVKSDNSSVKNLIDRIISKLPARNENSVRILLNYISYFIITPENKLADADDVMTFIEEAELLNPKIYTTLINRQTVYGH